MSPNRRILLMLLLVSWGPLCLAEGSRAPAPIGHVTATGAPEQAPPLLMLAQRYQQGVDVSAYWVSEKLDGVRAYWDGHRLITRGGQVIRAPPGFTSGFPGRAPGRRAVDGAGPFRGAVRDGAPAGARPGRMAGHPLPGVRPAGLRWALRGPSAETPRADGEPADQPQAPAGRAVPGRRSRGIDGAGSPPWWPQGARGSCSTGTTPPIAAAAAPTC